MSTAPRFVSTSSADPARRAWADLHFDAWYDELAAGEAVGRPDPATWRREELRAELETPAAGVLVHWVLALDGRGTAVGAAEVRLPLQDNTHVAGLALAVGPGHRRRGVGTALLQHVLDLVEPSGRTTVRGSVDRPVGTPEDEWPGLLALRRWGVTAGQREARRQLALPVPPERLAALEQRARPHAAGYALRTWAGPVPEEDLAAMARLSERMSTDAPHGDLVVEPEVWDAARIRDGEALREAQGRRQWLAVAAAPDGTLVGYTMLVSSAHEPQRLLQWDTLVVREHRGHRLGLLLKLAVLAVAVRDVPAAQRVTTWNAVSNTPMVAVNEAMGFVWDETVEECEAGVADLRRALAR